MTGTPGYPSFILEAISKVIVYFQSSPSAGLMEYSAE